MNLSVRLFASWFSVVSMATGITLFGTHILRAEESGIALRVEKKPVPSGRKYRIFFLERGKVEFRVSRPSENDPTILLVLPAAYTSPHGRITGDVLFSGALLQSCAAFKETLEHGCEEQRWNGAILFTKEGAHVIRTNYGALLAPAVLDNFKAGHSSLIQAPLLLWEGRAEPFPKQRRAGIRRALVVLRGGKEAKAIVESDPTSSLDLNSDPATKDSFAKDLLELQVSEAVLLDTELSTWGWYRMGPSAKVEGLGIKDWNARRQSNWIIFRSLPP